MAKPGEAPTYSISRRRLHPPLRPALWRVWRGITVPAGIHPGTWHSSGADRRSVRGGNSHPADIGAHRGTHRRPRARPSALSRGVCHRHGACRDGLSGGGLLLAAAPGEPSARNRPRTDNESGGCPCPGRLAARRAPRLRIRLGPGRRFRGLHRCLDHCRMGDRVAWPERRHLDAGSADAGGAVRPHACASGRGTKASGQPSRARASWTCSACPYSGSWFWWRRSSLAATLCTIRSRSFAGGRPASRRKRSACSGRCPWRPRCWCSSSSDPGCCDRLTPAAAIALAAARGGCPVVRRRFTDRCDGVVGDTAIARHHVCPAASCLHAVACPGCAGPSRRDGAGDLRDRWRRGRDRAAHADIGISLCAHGRLCLWRHERAVSRRPANRALIEKRCAPTMRLAKAEIGSTRKLWSNACCRRAFVVIAANARPVERSLAHRAWRCGGVHVAIGKIPLLSRRAASRTARSSAWAVGSLWSTT